MSGDCMRFPDTVEEFMDQYKVVDKEGIYMSKDAELVPIFRMEQWFEHEKERKKGRWMFGFNNQYLESYYYCSKCGGRKYETHKPLDSFCSKCGADMRRGEKDV